MQNRSVKKYTEVQHMNIGPFKVKQSLPVAGMSQVSPFILLHHAGPQSHAPGELQARLSPHPHRGFEPVTFLFSGKIHHRDSTGSEGFLEGGDVQWMTAGSGIIHSEGPSEAFASEGGQMELIQLWVNLPREHKMTAPKYQDIKKNAIPAIDKDGFQVSVVAGKYEEAVGPAKTFSKITAMTLHFEAGQTTTFSFPAHENVLLYVLDGSIETNGITVDTWQTAVYRNDGEAFTLTANTNGKALLLAGEPINEPMATYGPFVMNYEGELKQAITDYHAGKMGVLEG